MPLKYSAGWNLPGCLPEMEPVLFDTEEEARAFVEAEVELVEEARAQEEDAPLDPYVYWVELVEVSDEELADYLDALP